MGDQMRPMSFGHLMTWIMQEYRKEGTVFGVRPFKGIAEADAYPIFGEKMEVPFGPAAGPHTQLAQNIISAYLCGARFFELKTVQVIDGEELSACVKKPCILAKDEGYNCEWSTELTVSQAYEEYVKAWIACKVLAREWSLGAPDGFVFHMSVGYDLKGIRSPKVDRFIEGMKDASKEPVFRNALSWLKEHRSLFERLTEDFLSSISPRISASITESTLHGCPPEEIESIASYLTHEKHLHTYVKCNPTLLGYEFARKKLDALGYDYVSFDTKHFQEDLQWKDACAMFLRLQKRAKAEGVEFGVKLTNTFPVEVTQGELPGAEMYMSGRSLFPLTMELAKRVAEEFGGKLRISFSGGADLHNLRSLVQAGIWPVTVATTLLKPGGYERLSQLYEQVKDLPPHSFAGQEIGPLQRLVEQIGEDPYYKKPVKPLPDQKIPKKVPLMDCFTAPCSDGCPIQQDIPAYLEAMQRGKRDEALRIILEKNALPFMTGTLCPHTCTVRCMRNAYEEALHIREVKLQAALSAYKQVLKQQQEEAACRLADKKVPDKRVAVVGAGPAGLSAAFFLTRAGIPVTIFEKREQAGGIVRSCIPEFRIAEDRIDNDINLALSFGVELKTGQEVEDVLALLQQGFTDVILAIGAWKEGTRVLQYGEEMDALPFLYENKKNKGKTGPGRRVVVIGGGNTAMDVARAAKRAQNVEEVLLLYRRTRRYMPADEEELEAALREGVRFLELLSPIGHREGKLLCEEMELGEKDSSGRRSVHASGKTREIACDCVISAVGERVETELYRSLGLPLDSQGYPMLTEHLETALPHLFVAGDGRRGPATIVKAIADAARVAEAILLSPPHKERKLLAGRAEWKNRHRWLHSVPEKEAGRCLGCSSVCEVCAEVCPNRANLVLTVPGKSQTQILHADALCNECGNCAVFCPYESRPYRDKFTFFASREDFDHSENEGFLKMGEETLLIRYDREVFSLPVRGFLPELPEGCVPGNRENALPDDLLLLIRTALKEYAYLFTE